jgi:hypothetical protein
MSTSHAQMSPIRTGSAADAVEPMDSVEAT